MKILALLSVSPLVGFVFAPEFDSADVNVPIARTESSILSSSNEVCLVRFLGDESLDENTDYVQLVRVARSAQGPQPGVPASTLPSSGGSAMCSSGTGGGNANVPCSTNSTQTTCSVDGDDHSCSAGDSGGSGTCSATAGDESNRCSVHAGNASRCSAVELPGLPGSAQCSALGAGFCSVFGGGRLPGPGGGGTAGGQDNSCSAYGKVGETPQCSATPGPLLALCSVLKNNANATCSVVDSVPYGKGDGHCSTLAAPGIPSGRHRCSVIDYRWGTPTITPPKKGRCTTSLPLYQGPPGWHASPGLK